jgi:hypothetical protein
MSSFVQRSLHPPFEVRLRIAGTSLCCCATGTGLSLSRTHSCTCLFFSSPPPLVIPPVPCFHSVILSQAQGLCTVEMVMRSVALHAFVSFVTCMHSELKPSCHHGAIHHLICILLGLPFLFRTCAPLRRSWGPLPYMYHGRSRS